MRKEVSPFQAYRQSIMTAAYNQYVSHVEGIDISESDSRVMIAQNLGNGSKKAHAEATRAEAKANVAARAICRLAILRDEAESGHILQRAVARGEIALSRIIDRHYIADELGPDGMVEQIRGNTPAWTVEQ